MLRSGTPFARVVSIDDADEVAAIDSGPWTVTFDASVWGYGAALIYLPTGEVTECMAGPWEDRHCEWFGVARGECRYQAFWEGLTLYLVLLAWGSRHTDTGLRILGDAQGALTGLLGMKANGAPEPRRP